MRICGIVAGAAFVLSFLIGLVSRTSMPIAIIRPLVFGALFFIISCLINLIVNRFLPELLEDSGSGEEPGLFPGSRVNITVGDTSDSAQGLDSAVPRPAVPGALADDSEEGLGDISDLYRRVPVSQAARPETPAGMDQNGQDGYTKGEGFEDFPGTEPSELRPGPGWAQAAGTGPGGEAAGIPGGGANPMEVLPDLDSMAGAFIPAAGDEEPDTTEYSVSAPKKPSRDKTPAWTEDFNAKEIAMGLRTVLNKDKKEKEG